jgi:hypothetical protein
VRLTADVYDAQSGRSLGRAMVEGSPDSVYMLIDRLSIEVLRAVLGGEAEDLPRVDLARVTTASLPALRAYLDGEVLFRRADFRAAIPEYQRAVEADSTFALANHRLAQSYGWSQNIGAELALQAMDRAPRFADRLPEREAIVIRSDYALERGTLEGLEPLKKAVLKYPDDPELWYILAGGVRRGHRPVRGPRPRASTHGRRSPPGDRPARLPPARVRLAADSPPAPTRRGGSPRAGLSPSL